MKTTISTLSLLTLLSLNATAQWVKQSTGFSTPGTKISGISIVDKNTVWAAGLPPQFTTHYQVSRTTDGGNTWNKSTLITQPAYKFTGIHALNEDTAWVCMSGWNGGLMYRTTDGGQTWSAPAGNYFLAPQGAPFLIHFFDASNGICVGNPNGGWEVQTTTNGGISWTRVPQTNIPLHLMNEASSANKHQVMGDTVWFGTNAGRVYRSVNRGQNWTVSSTGFGYSSIATDVAFSDGNNGIAVDFNNLDSLKQTTNGGLTWTSVQYVGDYTGLMNFCDDICYAPSKALGTGAYVGTGYGSFYSLDKGATWVTIDADNHYTVAFLDSETGWSGGESLDSLSEGIYKWTGTSIGIKQVSASSINAKLYPNPFNTHATLELPADLPAGELSLNVYDLLGNKVKEIPAIHQRSITIDRENLANGIYFYRLLNESQTLATGKMIIE